MQLGNSLIAASGPVHVEKFLFLKEIFLKKLMLSVEFSLQK